ncbi:MAG: ketopantoate reductase family protein [Acidimicrobiales bacterium]
MAEVATKVCIIGCGAVGSLFAAHLAQLDEVEVFAYDLSADHVAAINESGLRLTDKAEIVGHLTATTDASTLPQCDFGIIATKGYVTRPAIEACAHAFADHGSVCSVQNGVGNEEIIAEYVDRVIRGTTFPAGHIVAPGTVAMDAAGDTSIGPFEAKPAPMDQVRLLAELCSRGGMPTAALNDARPAQWTKVIFNAATNSLGALTGLAHGEVCELADLRRLASGLVSEGVAVAAALGITPKTDPDELIDHAAVVAHDHRSSMLQDVLAKRRTEVDSLNGGIAAFGREHGVATPLNDAITALIHGLEASLR